VKRLTPKALLWTKPLTEKTQEKTEMNLTNRYDFVLLFDVKDGNPNRGSRRTATCRAWTLRPATA